MSKELSKKFFMTQVEELLLLEFNLKILTITKKLKSYILLLKVCFQVRLFSVEKKLLFKSVTFYQLVTFLRVLSFLMLNLEKEIMENSPELQDHLLLLLLTLKMDLRLELSYLQVLERLLIVSLEEWLELLELEVEMRNLFLRLEFNIGDIRLREKISLLLLVLEWIQLIILTEVVITSILVSHLLSLEDVFQVRRLV